MLVEVIVPPTEISLAAFFCLMETFPLKVYNLCFWNVDDVIALLFDSDTQVRVFIIHEEEWVKA